MSNALIIRHGTGADYDRIIPQFDAWWGGRSMVSMLPRLFFTHFAPWTYVAEQEGQTIGFLSACTGGFSLTPSWQAALKSTP